MENVQILKYNDTSISFQLEGKHKMINATHMAKEFNKRPVDWLKIQQTKDFLDALSKVKNVTLTDLVIVRKGGNDSGTWMQKDVALAFAQWLSPQFHAWCIARIQELLDFGITASDSIIEKIKSDPEYAKEILVQVEESRKKALELEQQNRELQVQIAKDASKVIFFDNVKQLNENDQKRKTFTVSQIASAMKLSGVALNRLLIQKGVITKINGHMYISDKYKSCNYAVERVTQTRRLNEDTDTWDMVDVKYLVWTQAGREFIIDFLSEYKKTKNSNKHEKIPSNL